MHDPRQRPRLPGTLLLAPERRRRSKPAKKAAHKERSEKATTSREVWQRPAHADAKNPPPERQTKQVIRHFGCPIPPFSGKTTP
jgi:hypothetical protein